MIMYTSGEIAKLCNLTVRTVQYYDKIDLIKPTNIVENRRYYSDEQLQIFQLVCLYKNLGLSLKEIKKLLQTKEPALLLRELLIKKKNELDDQINDMNRKNKKINILLSEIENESTMPVLSDKDLNDLMIKKDYFNSKGKLTNLFLIGYVLMLFVSILLSSLIAREWFILVLAINVVFLLFLVYFHAINSAYVCPFCHHKFTISWIKDLFSFNNGKKGKYLKCPSCKQKAWMKETYRD